MKRLFAVIAFVCLTRSANAATLYMGPGESYTTLQGAFAAMAAGDTLIIRDGVYVGTSNQIRYNLKPPTGTASAFTSIQAEHPGAVKFDGQNSQAMFDGTGTFNMSYVEFRGIEWINGWQTLTGQAHNNRTAHHIKFLRCGFENTIDIDYASYILLEDCYVWGSGRYNFITFTSDHVIFRRCISRLDAANGGGMPISNFVNYTSQFVEFQNCIAIDSDDNFYTNFEGVYGGFYVRKGNTIGTTYYSGTNTAFRGCLLLNVKHDRWGTSSPSESLAVGWDATNLLYENTVFWDMNNGMVIDNGLSANYTVNHCLFGITHSGSFPDMLLGNNSYGDVSNSIFYSIAGNALNDVKSSINNAFWGNGNNKNSVGTSSGDVTTINPLTDGGLKYLPRIESTGAFNGSATDGGDLGPTILNRIGVSGTLWGEPGYNTTGAEPLWPWPYEDVIQQAFRTGVASPNSSRGFCAIGQTLTKYIWEYLGSACPAEICNGEPPPPPPPAACGDGLDNDGDGLIDYPADPGCSSTSDTDEFNAPPPPPAQCADGIDNDGDGFIDLADPGCVNAADNDETTPPSPPPSSVIVTFDNPSPSGSSGSYLNGIFGGINWGTNKWRWEGAWLADSTKHIYFGSINANKQRTFTFSPGPKLFKSVRVLTSTAGILTLLDNLGQTKVQSISLGAMQLVTTGWSQPSTTVTVKFSAGQDLGVDDIEYVP